MNSKSCPKCKQIKPIALFSPDLRRADSLKWSCKQCVASDARIRRTNNLAIFRERERIYSRKNPRLRRANALLRKYGMSIDTYDAKVIQQNNLCAICNRLPLVLCVDHNHKTLQIRDLLCDWCNKIIGFVEKDLSYLSGLASMPMKKYCVKWGIV